MTPEEMFKLFRDQTECGINEETTKCECCDDEAWRMVKVCQKIQKDTYNQAIEDAVENAEVQWHGEEGDENCRVNKQSILKLRKE